MAIGPICPRRISRRSMIAKLESGEVLLTTGIMEVGIQVFEGIVARNVAFSQLHAEGVLVQLGHASALAKREPAGGIEAAGQLDLHVTLAFARTERNRRKGLLVQIKCDTHTVRLSIAMLARILRIATAEGVRK